MIIVDLELTGLDPEKHAIIDIAAIEFENPRNRFDCQCNLRDGAEIDDVSLGFNEYTKESISLSNISLEEAMISFLKWNSTISNRTISGMSNDTDILFLKKSFSLYNLPWDFGHRKIDIHSISYAIAIKNGFEISTNEYNTSNFNSDAIMEFVGIPKEKKPHIALNGVLCETEALSRLIYGKNLLPEFSKYTVPDYLL